MSFCLSVCMTFNNTPISKRFNISVREQRALIFAKGEISPLSPLIREGQSSCGTKNLHDAYGQLTRGQHKARFPCRQKSARFSARFRAFMENEPYTHGKKT